MVYQKKLSTQPSLASGEWYFLQLCYQDQVSLLFGDLQLQACTFPYFRIGGHAGRGWTHSCRHVLEPVGHVSANKSLS